MAGTMVIPRIYFPGDDGKLGKRAVGGSWLLARPVLMLERESWPVLMLERELGKKKGPSVSAGIRHDWKLLPPE
jgi:hypothetical protein